MKSCRKFAFTLAEVIITLGVIGVLAVLTVSHFVVRHQKSVTETQFKKIYSTLNTALMQSVSENGSPDTWAGLANNPSGGKDSSELMARYFTPYLKLEKDCGFKHKDCWAEKLYAKDKKSLATINGAYTGYSVILEDGMIVRFYATQSGLHGVYPFLVVDLNGRNNPNAMGYDIFVFALELRGKSYPYYGRIGPFMHLTSFSRNALLNGGDGCNSWGGTGGLSCAGLIVYDGFKIANDYKW